jgi:phthalate 4,5-dioxygenase reductase subunit
VPENTFTLVDEARSYLFICGDIGITPILSMIRSFDELLPLPWQAVLPVACSGDNCLP